MNPTAFEYQTGTLQKPENMTDDECGPLPIWSDGQQCVSLWKMSIWERLLALLYGSVWVQVHSGQTQPPIALTVSRKFFDTVVS